MTDADGDIRHDSLSSLKNTGLRGAKVGISGGYIDIRRSEELGKFEAKLGNVKNNRCGDRKSKCQNET